MEPSVATTVDLFRALHQQLRLEIADLDQEALHWTPGPETSCIATLVVHTLGSEGETLNVVRGIPSDRDRAAEFAPRVWTTAELVERLDRADAFLAERGAAISADDLAATRSHPRRGPASGFHLLLSDYGHAREHLAHIQLTKQLHRQRGSATSA